MAQVHIPFGSFNAGELSPLLGARFGVEKVANGCRQLRNFYVHTHGPVFRRPGTEHMGNNMGSGARSRLVGFSFSTNTGAMLEFHPNGLQVFSNGVSVALRTPVPLPYTDDECLTLQVVQVNDVCYIAHPNHAPMKLTRFADNDWRLEEVPWKWPALGDENVKAELASPAITALLTVPTYEWPEFTMPNSGTYSFVASNPDLTSSVKWMKLKRWNNNDWELLYSESWTTAPPAGQTHSITGDWTYRMSYTGPVAPAGGFIRTTWTASGGGSYTLPLDVIQPVSSRTVDVPAGDWEVAMICPPSIVAGSYLSVQVINAAGDWSEQVQMIAQPSQTVTWRGPTIVKTKKARCVWVGRAMMNGSATINSLAFPQRKDIVMSVNALTGDGRLSANKPVFQAGHVGSYWQLGHRRITPFVQIICGQPTIAAATSATLRVSGAWEIFTYGSWNTTLFLEKYIGGAWEILRSWPSSQDRNVTASGQEVTPSDLRIRCLAGTAAPSSGAAVPRFELQSVDAATYGIFKVSAVGPPDGHGKALYADGTVISDFYSTASTSLWTEGAFSAVKGFPRALAVHQARLIFGGTRSEPLGIWGSISNDFENMRRSSNDDAGFKFAPAAQEANSIEWMLSHERELVFGTGGDEWTISAENGPITPTNVLIQRRSSYGSRNLPALLANESIAFVQRGGRKVRQIAARGSVDAWASNDMTVLAEHVTSSGIVSMAAMTHPNTILWAVTGDGKLLGMTFETEQNVFGWHVHTTDGLFESVGVIRGVTSDEVWVAVNRNGARRIERFDSLVFTRDFTRRVEMIYLDAARKLVSLTPVSALSGLDHLEGREVTVVGDGAVQASRSVVGGAIALEIPAKVVMAGLPFCSVIQPMRVEIPLQDGTAQFRKFRTSRVGLSLHDSIGGDVACAVKARPEPINYRVADDPMDEATALFTGEIETAIEASVTGGIDVVVRQTAPLPFCVGEIVVKGDVYGE